MKYNEVVKIGLHTYKWIEILQSRFQYKRDNWHLENFCDYSNENECQKYIRLYNWTQGAFDYAKHHGWHLSEYNTEWIIEKYFYIWKEGE